MSASSTPSRGIGVIGLTTISRGHAPSSIFAKAHIPVKQVKVFREYYPMTRKREGLRLSVASAFAPPQDPLSGSFKSAPLAIILSLLASAFNTPSE